MSPVVSIEAIRARIFPAERCSALALFLRQMRGMERKTFVYVLRSCVDSTRHYVGLTAAVVERVDAHNAGQSIHTASKKPWALVVSIDFREERLARRFEHYLKSGSGRAFAKRHFAGQDIRNRVG